MLYARSREPELADDLFRDPPCDYRGAPFWAWNETLDADRLRRQIRQMKRMGLGGFHMHSRTGLGTPYLDDDFMACVRACVDEARDQDMLAWLYDEDRWPSGAAGGLVTCDHRYRIRSLRITPRELEVGDDLGRRAPAEVRYVPGSRDLVATYAVRIEDGLLVARRRIADPAEAGEGEAVWRAYREVAGDATWFNNQAYLDTLNAEAVARFREETHERYRAVVGGEFGSLVPAIFTDEPQVRRVELLDHGDRVGDVVLPWTDDLPESYREAHGDDLLNELPDLIWEPADGRLPPVRWRFRDHVAERFATAFADVLGAWCGEHGIALTGHMMDEPTLESQSHSIMEAMRHYRGFQLPGIDMLCDAQEFTTAKQAQSAARQFGRPGVLSELYGVTNWDFPFEGHKRQGDWQAVLGVTARVHHLSWVSMAGNAKRDYPASIGYQSPWWREYPLIEDHFARLNTLLTRGRPLVRLAVIHPIESFWLCRGPTGQCRDELQAQEGRFRDLADWLLHGLLDFDYVAESLLPSQQEDLPDSDSFAVGAMRYDAVVVPALRTIRATTLDRLEAFADAGGRVLFAGRVPDHVDAIPGDRAERLAGRCERLPFERPALLASLEDLREIDVRDGGGGRPDDCLAQIRVDSERRHAVLCCTRRERRIATRPWSPGDSDYEIRFPGRWRVLGNDTLTGERRAQPCRHEAGRTVVRWTPTVAGSLAVTLEPDAETGDAPPSQPAAWHGLGEVRDPVAFVREEPNVLVLDQGEFRRDDGAWLACEEIHRAENRIRKELGWPPKTGAVAQPWVAGRDHRRTRIAFRFAIASDVAVAGARLAVERPDATRLRFDGEEVPAAADGWWVDEAIRTVPLPDFGPGEHELIVERELNPADSWEWCYLLGDFGVDLRGRHARLVPLPETLTWGNAAAQELPFYAGNLTYRCRIALEESGEHALRLPHWRGALVRVELDGRDVGRIAFDPYRCELGHLGAGEHELVLTVFGNRVNAFGALHNCAPGWRWWGPPAWDTRGDAWSYEYQLRPFGLLTAPVLERPSVRGG